MKLFRVQAVACLLIALLSAVARGHETDPYSAPPGREFADIGDYFTPWVYQALERAVERANFDLKQKLSYGAKEAALTTPGSVDDLADAVFSEFPNAYETIEGLERKLHSKAFKGRYPGKVVAHKTTMGQIYQSAHFPLDPRRMFKLWFASNFRAYGSYMGSDKVGHFIDMGHNYYGEYRKSLRAGKSEKFAVADAVKLGTESFFFSESGLLGVVSAGAYSNADLASNYTGMLFYKNLTEPVKLKGVERPAMVVREGVYWKLAPHVRPNSDFFSWFISDHFDEALNPSLFDGSMRGGMRKAVAARAENLVWRYRDANGSVRSPQYFDELISQLGTYWGEDYGHKGGLGDLVTLGNACFKPVTAAGETNVLGHTALHWAVLTDNPATVQRLLGSKVEVDTKMRPVSPLLESESGNTALHLAVRNNRTVIVDLLLSHGANVNAVNGWKVTPLHHAARHPQLAGLLISRGANVNALDTSGRTPLHWAVNKTDGDAVGVLLESGADAGLRDHEGRTALHLAVASGNEPSVSRLLTAGADANVADRFSVTPLHLAAVHGRGNILGLLLDKRADPNAADRFGYTPLHIAARHGELSVARALLDRGAAVGPADVQGSTPLHLAGRHGSQAIASLLMGAGADIHARNQAGSTPLHEAAYSGNRSIFIALTAAGADSKTTDKLGQTPAALASSRGHRLIGETLGGRRTGAAYGTPRTSSFIR